MYLPSILLILFLVFLFRKDLFNKDIFSSTQNPFSEKKKMMTIDDKYNEQKVIEKNELNKLLEKINQKGFENLSIKEKKRLEELSKNQK